MGPMLGRKVVEAKQDFFIFLQAFAGLWEFGLVTGDELIVSCQSRFPGWRQVHFVNELLGFALDAFGHLIEDVERLMHPATLLGDLAVFFLQSDPETQRTVSNSQLRGARKSHPFELAQKFTPGLGAFSVTINHREQLLVAILGGADYNQYTAPL